MAKHIFVTGGVVSSLGKGIEYLIHINIRAEFYIKL